MSQRPQPRRRHDVTVRNGDLALLGQRHELCEPHPILRESLVVLQRLCAQLVVTGGVDLVSRTSDRRQTTRKVTRRQRLRVGGQVPQQGESAEGLAQHRPSLNTEVTTDVLAVLDDLVGTQVSEVLRLAGRIPHRLAHWRGQSSAALVQQHELVVLQGPGQPARESGITQRRPRRLTPRAALQKDEVRLVGAVRSSNQTRINLDGAQVLGVVVVQRDPEANVIC